jgi:hypothetical protein
VTAGFGLELKNVSQDTFTSLTVDFDREVWRNQSAAAVDTLSFAYGLASAGIGSGNFLTNTLMSAFSALDATSPAELGNATSAGRNGNADALAVSATITGLTWEPGDSLFLRWNDYSNGSRADGYYVGGVRVGRLWPPAAACARLLMQRGSDGRSSFTLRGLGSLAYDLACVFLAPRISVNQNIGIT